MLRLFAGLGSLWTRPEAAITALDTITPPTRPPRARGALRLSTKTRDGASVIEDLRQSGSYRLMFPRSAPGGLTAVAVNCAGGMTGGDRFELRAKAGIGSCLTVTTQAAERIYRATSTEEARLSTHLQVEAGARLNWLPQETILFDRSRFARRLEVDLAQDASFLMVEPMIFGRTAMGEHLHRTTFTDHVRLRRAGQLIHADATRLDGDIEQQLRGRAVAGSSRAMAAIVLACAKAEQMLEPARALVKGAGAASLKSTDLLVIRMIARDAMALRRAAIPLIARLSGHDIPKTWTL